MGLFSQHFLSLQIQIITSEEKLINRFKSDYIQV